MQYIYKLKEWLFSVGFFFRLGIGNWKEEISNSVCVALHNVLFGQYVFLPTEQAETYLKIYVLIYHST